MKKKNAYSEATAGVSGSGGYVDPSRYGLCCVNGCRQPGALTLSTTGTDQWYCALHFRQPASLHASITTRSNNREDMLRVARKLRRMPLKTNVPADVELAIRAAGYSKHIAPGDSANVAGRKLDQVLDAECRVPQSTLERETANPHPNDLDDTQ